MEPGDGVGGVDKIARLPGETGPANPADSVLQGPTELPEVFDGLDMVYGFFALHLHGRGPRYYLAREQILGYRGKQGDRLNSVDLDIGREVQFICMGAESTFNRKLAELLPIQLSGRLGCLDETGILPNPISGFESWGGGSSLVLGVGMPALGGDHLRLNQGVDLPQVGGCLVCARLLQVLDWLVEVKVHSGVSSEGGEEWRYLRSFGCGVVGGKLA